MFRRLRAPRAFAICVTGLGLALGACAGGDGQKAAPADLADQVIDATVAAGTAHFETALDGDADPGLTPLLRFEGDVSFARNAARYDVDAVTGLDSTDGLPSQSAAESIIVGGHAWERGDEPGEPWREVPVNFDVLAPWNAAGTITPAAALRAALVPARFETIGDDEIDGTDLVHYRSVDGDRTIELWVDDDDRIRLVTSDEPHPDPSYAEQGVRERWVLQLSDLGEPVDEFTPPV